MSWIDRIEAERLRLQADLDGQKKSNERNKLGQFATPTALAREILKHGRKLLPDGEKIRFFDPGIGTGSFYSALRAVVEPELIESAQGFEVDQHYGAPARDLWHETELEIQLVDFTKAAPEGEGANLLICNPPYVRHHHMTAETKGELRARTYEACGVKINGLSGLYCYFMGLAHRWMAPGGVAGWLIPSEFMGTNYGKMLRRYLLDKVTLLQIHRYDPQDAQFADAIVSSAVVWIRHTPPPKGHKVVFTYGGTLTAPTLFREVAILELKHEQKWTRYPHAEQATRQGSLTLGELFEVKRGLATGDNSFFIMDRADIEERGLPIECFRPVLPGSRYLPDNEILADETGLPQIDKQLFLLDTRLFEDEIAERYPALRAYLERGNKGKQPVAGRYLCRLRKPWYAQEQRPAAPIICTYMGRRGKAGKPFRFILNHSKATACNVFLMLYPKPRMARIIQDNPEAMRLVWRFLNNVEPDDLLNHGRVYGGGLHKLEPKELRGFPIDPLLNSLPDASGKASP
ncbi:MAG: SAM-dependent DNA methyltransferase [Rhodobacteraceae bacterium]|nr:SAM-dependent DNA methyltransferase [Paracoccaceae bacterium]